MRGALLAVALLAAGLAASPVAAAEWEPAAWADESTLELRTTERGEGEHWSPVWLVVLDGQVYVRLGRRAAGRIERNAAAPWVGVRVHGQQFDRVQGVLAPEQAARVAAALADKYRSDVFVRWLPHPLTLRLEPEAPAAE